MWRAIVIGILCGILSSKAIAICVNGEPVVRYVHSRL